MIWSHRKCDICKDKYRKKKGFVLNVNCLDDKTGDPITVKKRICPDCAKVMEGLEKKSKEMYEDDKTDPV